MMRTFVVWIQPHPHGAILRHISNMVISFLCSSVNYLENQLLPNDLIIVRDHENDEEDERDIKRVLERQGEEHIKAEIQSNLEF
jgi:riboflavin synthase